MTFVLIIFSFNHQSNPASVRGRFIRITYQQLGLEPGRYNSGIFQSAILFDLIDLSLFRLRTMWNTGYLKVDRELNTFEVCDSVLSCKTVIKRIVRCTMFENMIISFSWTTFSSFQSISQRNSSPGSSQGIGRANPPSQQLPPRPGQPRQQQGKGGFVICEICDGYIKDLEQLKNHMNWIHKVEILIMNTCTVRILVLVAWMYLIAITTYTGFSVWDPLFVVILGSGYPD